MDAVYDTSCSGCHLRDLKGSFEAPQLAGSPSLTIGRANALLVHAPSLKEAFDDLSFQPQPASQPEGKQSALAALSKENIKL